MSEGNTLVSPAPEPVEAAQDVEPATASEAEEATPDDVDAPEAANEDDGTADQEADDSESDEDEGEEEAPDETDDKQDDEDADTFEVEVEGGTKYRIPKALEGRFLMQKDYTQKTQAVAETRRASDELKAVTERVGAMTYQESAAYHEHQQAAKALGDVNKELEGYANFNWQAAEQQNYDLYRQHENYFRQLTAQKQALESQANAARGKMQELGKSKQEAQAEEQTKRIAAVEAYAKQKIDGWNQDLDSKIGEMAKEVAGVTDAWMAQNLTPEMYHLAYYALIGKQSLEAAKAKPKPAPKALKPTSKVKSRGGRGGQKNGDQMTYREFEAARNAGTPIR